MKTHQDLDFPPSLSAGVWWLAQALLDTLLVSFQYQNTAVLWEHTNIKIISVRHSRTRQEHMAKCIYMLFKINSMNTATFKYIAPLIFQ